MIPPFVILSSHARLNQASKMSWSCANLIFRILFFFCHSEQPRSSKPTQALAQGRRVRFLALRRISAVTILKNRLLEEKYLSFFLFSFLLHPFSFIP
jgi:hypothetical protein